MAELCDVVSRLQKGHGVRAIQRSTGVHRTIIRELRRISEERGWLQPESPLPTEAEVEQIRLGAVDDRAVSHQLDEHLDEIKLWVEARHSYVVMYALIHERVACSESTLRRYVRRRFGEACKIEGEEE